MFARLTPLLAVAATLLFAAPASADTFNVTRGDDSIETACTEVGASGSGVWDCTTLRAAVAQANGSPADVDTIELPARTYTIDRGEITIGEQLNILGDSARTTMIQGDNESRLFHILPSATNVVIGQVTLAGGHAPVDEDGGNILNAGTLLLHHVHLTQGSATRGGGAATVSPGTTLVISSLVDANQASSGGGLAIIGPVDSNDADQTLGVEVSTVTDNTADVGAGIFAIGVADVGLLAATVSANHGPGIQQAAGAQAVAIFGSIVAANEGPNCQTNVAVFDAGGNIDDHNTCAFGSSGSRHDTDPLIAHEVSNQGGQTDILPIAAGSPAIDLDNPCILPIDQRDVARTGDDEDEPCDSGAFELTPGSNQAGGSAPTIVGGTGVSPDGTATFAFSGTGSFECRLDGPTAADIGTFTTCTSPVNYSGLKPGVYVFHVRSSRGETFRQFSVAPPAQATPTPTPTATPVPQQDATGKVVSGKVLIKIAGKFVPLDPSKPIPSGSEIDVKKGKIELTAVLKPGGKPEKATFYDGIFKLTLGKKTTDLTLSEKLAPCGKKGKAGAAAKKPKTRKLWGSGSGSFRTRGQYSAATVRGTTWLVQDSCSGTLTKVTKGVVSVFDQVKKKTIIVRAPKSYTAKPRR